MSDADEDNRAGKALLVAVATAIAGFLPATFAYDRITGWISPMKHAEEAMGRGLELLLIGGPLSTLALVSLAGWMTFRSRSPHTNKIAIAFVIGCAIISFAIVRWTKMF